MNLKFYSLGLGEIAQLLKHLSVQREDMSFNPQGNSQKEDKVWWVIGAPWATNLD